MGYYSEYNSYNNRTEEFGSKLEDRWEDYKRNLFNQDPNYNIDVESDGFESDLKEYLLGLMSDKNGVIDFTKLRLKWKEDE